MSRKYESMIDKLIIKADFYKNRCIKLESDEYLKELKANNARLLIDNGAYRGEVEYLKDQLRVSECKARDLADKLVDEMFAHEETRKQMQLIG